MVLSVLQHPQPCNKYYNATQSILHLEQTPALPAPTRSLVRLRTAGRISLLPRLQLPQAVHLLEDMFQQLFSLDDVKVPLDLRVLLGETVDGAFVELAEVLFEHAGELVVEFAEELGIEE